MSVANAKDRLNRAEGEPPTGFISSDDIKASYDDLESAWQGDIAASGDDTITGTPNGYRVGSPGDVVRQTDSAVGITWWIKETGVGTADGWVMRDGRPALSNVTYNNLSKWRAALARARNGGTSAHVLWLGTSNPYGEGATDMEVNGAPFALASNLNAASLDSVRFLEPTNSRSLEGTWSRSYMNITAGWTIRNDTLVADKGGLNGGAGAGGEFTYSHPDCEYFTLVARDWINTFDMTVDGGTAQPQVGANTGPAIPFTVDCGGRGAHTLKVDNVQGADSLRVVAVGGGLYDGGILVSNYGVSGSHSDNWVKDAHSEWASLVVTFDPVPPDLTIITLGGSNELAGAVTPSAYQANLESIITDAQETGDVILNGPCWSSIEQDEYRLAAESAAGTMNVPYLDVVKVLQGDPEKYETGGHFNADAHRIWARATQAAMLGL